MKARILEKSEEKRWERFIETHPLSTIHQTPAWGHFQSKIPSRGEYWIVVLEENKKIIGGTVLIRYQLPGGFTWLYAARGPLLDYASKEIKEQMKELLKAIKPIAKEENAIFLRIDPPLTGNKAAKLNGFHHSAAGFQPQHTIILDISKSKDAILEQMKSKGRYNIRLAEKKGVKIHKVNFSKPKEFQRDIRDFYQILLETAIRDGFREHEEKYYKKMIEMLSLKKNATLYLARYDNKTIAGIIVTFFRDTATYYYGASSNEYRNVMGPYLLHWHAIKDLKEKGYKHYDFFGIAPPGTKKHAWLGVTEFKKKFGGQVVSYQMPREFAFKKGLHLLYRLYKKL